MWIHGAQTEAWVAGIKFGALGASAAAADQLGGIVSEIGVPLTFVGAVLTAYQMTRRAQREAVELHRETAREAAKRLDEEQERWRAERRQADLNEAALRSQIAGLVHDLEQAHAYIKRIDP